MVERFKLTGFTVLRLRGERLEVVDFTWRFMGSYKWSYKSGDYNYDAY